MSRKALLCVRLACIAAIATFLICKVWAQMSPSHLPGGTIRATPNHIPDDFKPPVVSDDARSVPAPAPPAPAPEEPDEPIPEVPPPPNFKPTIRTSAGTAQPAPPYADPVHLPDAPLPPAPGPDPEPYPCPSPPIHVPTKLNAPPAYSEPCMADELEQRWHTALEIGMSASVLIFGIMVMLMEIMYLKSRSDIHPTWVLKIIGLSLVITAGLYLIVAGFSQTQTAAMMGLLGTVAGYLLGKEVQCPLKDAK